jgi:glyoxylate utilization-related uncharacterized protein
VTHIPATTHTRTHTHTRRVYRRFEQGLNQFFSWLLEISNFFKFFRKSLENIWKTNFNFSNFRADLRLNSVTLYPTASERYFRTSVRRHDHVASYKDDKIKKIQVVPPYVCWACPLPRPRAACAGG